MKRLNRNQIEKIRSMLIYMLSDIAYADEFFSLLFVDVGNSADSLAEGLFGSEDRRVAVYGPRGVGKSAILQGIAFSGIQHGMLKLPVVAKIGEARSVSTVAELEDRFFTAVAKAIASIPNIHSNWSKVTKEDLLAKYSPWLATAVSNAASIFSLPLAIVSRVISDTIRSVVKPSNYRSLEELLTSSSIKAPRLADLLVTKLYDQSVEPVFIIDELDKITDSDVVHNFIEGNQSWFEGKNVVLTMSHNIGESLKKISTGSISRIASPKPYMGLTNTKEGEEIIHKRAVLGYSSRYRDQSITIKNAQQEVYKILPESVLVEIIEQTFPNPSRMLRLTYDALEEAATKGKSVPEALRAVTPVKPSTTRITKRRLQILETLSAGPMTLTELARSLDVSTGSLFVTLGRMVSKGFLQTTKDAGQVHYHLTENGNTILRLNT